MTRRFAVAATAFVALSSFALHVPEAGAFTSATKQCLSLAKTNFNNNKHQAAVTLLSQYVADRAACFGPGQACANACQITLNGCAANPTADRLKCQTACNTAFKGPGPGSVQACSTDPNPLGCATAARVTRLQCITQCSVNDQPAFDACNSAYSDCVQQCASCAPGSTCGNP
jgi:hypothetical protein